MTGTEIYKHTPTYERQSREIRLLAPHWKLLLAFDGQRTLSEVALSAEMSFADALPLTQKFLDQSWIEEQPITLEQYLKRANLKDATSSTAVPPPTVLHEPKPESTPAPAAAAAVSVPAAPVIPAPPAPAIAAPVAMSIPAVSVVAAPTPPPLPVPAAVKAPAPSEPSFILSTPAQPPALPKPEDRVMKLSAVVDFITSLVGHISVGQLLVYRVFLRVPPDLLMAEDVASVYLVKDTSLIKTPALQKAIADAVNSVAKRALPDSVYVTA